MKIVIANSSHSPYASIICSTIEKAAQKRGTGIAKRDHNYIISKIKQSNAVIALDNEKFAGFCYIESWEHGKFVANSGLIVHPSYRGIGLAKQIKKCYKEGGDQKQVHFSVKLNLFILEHLGAPRPPVLVPRFARCLSVTFCDLHFVT